MAILINQLNSMKHNIVTIFFLLFSTILFSQQEVINLYKGTAPGSESWNWTEKETSNTPIKLKVIYNITTPTLTFFPADSSTANGSAIIICPGGGFRVLNIEHEGINVARELNKKGVAVFILKYRLVKSNTETPWEEMINNMKDMPKFRQNNLDVLNLATRDAETAMRYVKNNTDKYHIDKNKIGIIGFSAGGALAIRLSLSEQVDIIPDFSGFIYSTFNPNDYNTPTGITPPAFIACATDDMIASPSNSIELYNLWINNKRPAELHIFTKGGHGLRGSVSSKNWIHRFTDWLNVQVIQQTN